MILKDYQGKVVKALTSFFKEAKKQKDALEKVDKKLYVDSLYRALDLDFRDRPQNGLGEPYPRVCLKVPTGGGKTLIAIEAIREYQNLFAQKRTGLVVWITHRETIYRQTIENLRNKNHVYRQWLDQCSGNKTLIVEKGNPIRKQDVEDNLVVLMLMMGSANRTTKENLKVFKDSGAYLDFFPHDNQHKKHEELLKKIPNLDFIPDNIFNRKIVKTSLGNVIRVLNPLIIVDEFHTMFSDNARNTLDGLNPAMIVGLSATPLERKGMNVLVEITGKELESEDMIKLDMHLYPPTESQNWKEMIDNIQKKRESLEKKAVELRGENGTYIRPIALIQVERTGKEQRGKNFIHSEDVREYLISKGISAFEIAVKSSELDEIKEEKLLSESCEIRYIITKEALKEGWDCSFAYILGVIPSARSESSMTQLVGRILRQPYAKKTGVSELDESYVYFTRGETIDVLKNITKGFNEEGLGDLVKNVNPESGPTGSRKVKTKIRQDILNKYPESLYLPVWVVKEKNSYRRFSYEVDIKPSLKWDSNSLGKWLKENILPLLNNQKEGYEYLIDLEKTERKELKEDFGSALDKSYLARRITDVTDNAFISYEIAEKLVKEFKKLADKNKIDSNSGFITQEIVKRLEEDKEKQEKEIFDKSVKNKKLRLVVSADEKIGYSLPKESEVYPDEYNLFSNNLFEKSDRLSMNDLEARVANLVDKKEDVLWWVRNMAEKKSWYAVNGWKKGKIRPDFVVAKKGKSDSLELVYIMESKGKHLMDNPDTAYKAEVFDKMNKEKVEDVGISLIKFKMNKNFQFELVGEGEEERKMAMFFNR